ncbi:MAG: TraB/GumN family protein [Roseiarcus sp.]|jgi:uncharacterized protein YbaP (TraB family)
MTSCLSRARLRGSRARLRAAILAAFALALVAPVSAEEADAPKPCVGKDLAHGVDLSKARLAHADDLVNSQGLLWRIEREGLAPSYLFGTIHSTDDSAIAIARKAAEFVAGAKVVATELGGPFDAVDQGDLAATMFAKAIARDEDTFGLALTGQDAATVEDFLARRGFPKEMAHHLQLWFLAAAASAPNCEAARERLGAPEVDSEIALAGKARGLPVVALESAGEQLQALAAAPPSLSATLLAATARAPDLEDDAYATLLRLYRDKRPAEMLAVADLMPGLTAQERAAEEEFARLLLVGRNEVMAERAAPLLAKGGAFIAVGALHLTGKDGLIERFRAAGYRVVDVW